MADDFSRRILLSLDLKDYSSHNDVDQHKVQQALVRITDVAAEHAGFPRKDWLSQQAGDGELVLFPEGTAEARVVDALPEAFALALSAHNRRAPHAMRLRLRIALHQGLVRPAAGGYAGKGVVDVSRLVSSHVAREALRVCPDADLVVLLSSQLYLDLVPQGHTRLTVEDFREVTVHNKRFHSTAWLHVPGYDVRDLELGPEPVEPVPTEPVSQAQTAPGRPSWPGPQSSHQTNFYDEVVVDEMVIGVQNRNG
jgi:hypothetical protein